MGCDITEHILRGCKNLQGGVNIFYLFSYTKYSRSQITVKDEELTVFPATSIFKVQAESVSFNENSSFEGGSEVWDQSFSFSIPKTIKTSPLFKLLKKDYRLIYTDRNGISRILGLYNGLQSQINNETGTNKEDLNGYKVTVTGKEDNQAYFIDDIGALGFIIGYNFIFQDNNNYDFQDSNNFILQ